MQLSYTCIFYVLLFKVGRSVDETLRLVQAFQFTEEHGEGEQCMCMCACGVIMIVIARSLPCWLETWWIDGK